MSTRTTCVVVDLPALAAEFVALADVAVPMTSERLAVVRAGVAAAIGRLLKLDRTFDLVEQALEVGEPGNDFDFAVRDLLGAQRDLHSAQTHITCAAQLLMRTNIALTAAATIADRDDENEVH